MESPIRHISDTARWAAMFRAEESKREDALFHDPFAARLGGERGAQIMTIVPHAADNAWAWVMRTYLFDRVIRHRVLAGVRTVLNLAAGLDARPYRMDLPADLHWVDVDLPDLLAYKQETLAGEQSRCKLESVAMDLADAGARRELLQRFGKGLVISEGLLIYLPDEQVADLARDLANARFDFWLFDLLSPSLLMMLQATTGRMTADAGAPYRFAPKARTGFFEPLGWKASAIYPVFETALETGRFPKEMLAGSPPQMPPGVDVTDIWSATCLLQRA
jgi:methyltransferase (TIGR00027 family)